MSKATGISRRIQQCIQHLQENDYEGALVNLFPAIDKTAQKRRPEAGVGARIKSFLKDEEVLITAVGTGNVFRDCIFDGMSFEEALYKFGRTPIAHEGELDPRLTFNPNGGLQIGKEQWNLPLTYIVGMTLAVIAAPENTGEHTAEGLGIMIFGKQFDLNNIWGKPAELKLHICNIFHDPNLFDYRPQHTTTSKQPKEKLTSSDSKYDFSKHQTEWIAIDKPVSAGDRVTIDFVGSINGVEFEGGRAKDFILEIGQGRMIPGFEDGLIGRIVGDEVAVPVKFPEDYHAANLRGKDALFTVKIQKLETPMIPLNNPQ